MEPRVHVAALGALALGFASVLAAQAQPTPTPSASGPIVTPTPFTVQDQVFRKLSDHVWEIPDLNKPGNPNVVMVVGTRATLIVDTGMGPRSGAVVARRAQSLSANTQFYLVTSDFRPEHITGAMSLPANTVWIVPEGQKADIHHTTQSYIDSFTARSAGLADTLKGVKLREPDITFDRDAAVDLGGGVVVKLFWFGPALTNGDVAVFIEPDQVLYSGNFLASKSYPGGPHDVANFQAWLNDIDQLEPLHPKIIIPNHGDVRDGSLITDERLVLRELQARARELKAQGVSAEDAGSTLTAEFDAKRSDWKGLGSIPTLVRRFYEEP
jgi:glyoxylase-like metal-dependent hydrolase (beta-lactamase superfamily II)